MRKVLWVVAGTVLLASSLGSGCAYRLIPGPLVPLPEGEQAKKATVEDDGTVTIPIDRLRISLQPVSDGELNRQFSTSSQAGKHSVNPYTFGNWIPEGASRTPKRFTVFLLVVENYAYPKVLLDPHDITIRAANGRVFEARGLPFLKEYYYPYARAYTGNSHADFRGRVDILAGTMYPAEEMVFAGQTVDGYVVFPKLHDDVRDIVVQVPDVALRFDYRDEPIETADLAFHFHRDVGRAP